MVQKENSRSEYGWTEVREPKEDPRNRRICRGHGGGLNISSWKQARRIVVQNLALRRRPNRQSVELLNVPLDLRNARPRPVRAPQNFICEIFDSRKVLHQLLWRNAGDIHVHVLVPAN